MAYQATFETGWRATLIADSRTEAQSRFQTMGRGERFTLRTVAKSVHQIFDRDGDVNEDYTDGE